MYKPLLTLLLSALLTLPAAGMHAAPKTCAAEPARLWWGMIDPELSLWFSRLPMEEQEDSPILWDFSWRGFLAALTGQPILTEVPHAPLS